MAEIVLFLCEVAVLMCAPFVAHMAVLNICPRYALEYQRQKGIIVALAVGAFFFAVLLGAACVSGLFQAGILFYFFLVYCLSGYCYFHVFNMSETGRRVRMLGLVPDSGFEEAGLARLDEDPGSSNERRARRLAALGQVEIRDGRVYMGRRALLVVIAGIAAYIGKLLRVGQDD